MPTFRPFRGLRFDRGAGDLADLICPPYDVISAAERERLLGRHAHNAVRIEFPVLPGHEDGGYARAGETLRSWRSQGILRLDPSPSLSVYEARYRLGDGPERTQRGVFGRLRLEPLGDGIRPHERTLSAPKEDRLRLLRATATDTSPIVVLSDAAGLGDAIDQVIARPPDAEATDEAGVAHRLWVVHGDDEAATVIGDAVAPRPLTIADGHHRYETALRYRDEVRSAGRRDEEAPADDVLALVLALASGDGPTILPTHRVLQGDSGLVADLVRAVHGHFAVDHRPGPDLVVAYSPPFTAPAGRIGVITPRLAAELAADGTPDEPLFPAATPDVVRELDVAVLDAVLRPFLSDHPDVTLSYTHDAWEAAKAVESGGAIGTFLLSPTPLGSIIAVAADGEAMPQKSTYFYPKVATGLVMYPLE